MDISDFIDAARTSTIMVGGKNAENALPSDTPKQFEMTCEMKEVKKPWGWFRF